MARDRKVRLEVQRQDGPGQPKYWQQFEVPWQPHMNVISALMGIQKKPETATGEKTTPVVWESVCLEEVCGSCTMLVNGRVRQSCSAMIDLIAPEGQVIDRCESFLLGFGRDFLRRVLESTIQARAEGLEKKVAPLESARVGRRDVTRETRPKR